MSPKLLNILLAVLPLVLYSTIIDPLNTGTGQLWSPRNSISALQALQAQYEVALNNTSVIEKDVDSVYKDYKKLDPAILEKNNIMLSDSVDVAKLRNEIVAIGSRKGVALNSLEVAKDRKGGKVAEFYLISFSLKSRYLPFKELLEEFEKSTRFYTIESLSINRQKVDSGSKDSKNADIDKDILNIQVKFRVYQARS